MKSANSKPPMVRDTALRLMIEQLDQIEDLLGEGTGPAVDPPAKAVVNLTKVVRSLVGHVDGMELRAK